MQAGTVYLGDFNQYANRAKVQMTLRKKGWGVTVIPIHRKPGRPAAFHVEGSTLEESAREALDFLKTI